ncbi:MAG TPA: hypothetical protein VGS12_03735 [Caulobacteraceae bacterium]|nr:hypothetical protein [Caulobacteraceae bacterium]
MAESSVAQIGWPALRAHPRFREAVELNARLILAHKDRHGPVLFWMTGDMGRSSTLNRALMRYAREGAVSVADVLAWVRQRSTVSDGRALQVLRRAEGAGLMRIEPRSGPWRGRNIIILPLMVDFWRGRAAAEIESASLVLPAIGPCLERLQSDGFYYAFLSSLHRFDGMAPQARGPANPAMRHFMAHEGGLMMLYDLLLRQAPERERLLEAAPFSRTRLASRFHVSRTHVRRVFAEAEAAGWLALEGHNSIVFGPEMSEQAERHFALTFYVMGSCAEAAASALDAAPTAGARQG